MEVGSGFGTSFFFFSFFVVLLPLSDIWQSFLIVHAAFAIVVGPRYFRPRLSTCNLFELNTSESIRSICWMHLLPNRRASSDSAQHLLSGATDDRCYIIMTFFGYFLVRVKCVFHSSDQLVSKRVHFCVRCLMKCAPCAGDCCYSQSD